jgi:hypothetical protein
MVKLKKKSETDARRLRSFGKQSKVRDIAVPGEVVELRAVWNEEVTKFSGRRFASVEVAIEELCNAIFLRLAHVQGAEEGREFIRQLFMEDEMLRNELEEVLDIG